MTNARAALPISVIVPTYLRERVLTDTIEYLLALEEGPSEIIIVDQTPQHTPETSAYLEDRHRSGAIRLLHREQPSITAAMNVGLLAARQPIVLFLDDDIRPDSSLCRAHANSHHERPGVLVAGRVVQPWDKEFEETDSSPHRFASRKPRWITEFMGGNFSALRADLLALGGFDENFVRVAYRFESEFAHRWRASGRRIRFEPGASIDHLKAHEGGTRSYGHHLTTWRPDHAVGAYYFALRTRTWRDLAIRPLRSVTTRFHLAHPWRIPATLASELGGMLWAFKLFASGPRRLKPSTIAR